MADTLTAGAADCLRSLDGGLGMRVRNNAHWINRNTDEYWNEIYRRNRHYDIVMFSKAMDVACQAEAARLRQRGTRTVFGANVNYYDIWGDYEIAGTRPSPAQQRDAIAMTREADHVVADSSYIAEIARRYNPNVTWIPDNVDLTLFSPRPAHADVPLVQIVWSGISKKADHFTIIRGALASLDNTVLVLVSDAVPAITTDIQNVIPVRFVPYSDAAYAATLRGCDIIISPKRLANGYEMGHTEYKITLGMAVGLPAVASPQPSYVEAISHAGGGIIAETPEQWQTALQSLVRDSRLRAALGERAARTVLQRYSTAVTATAYLDVLRGLSR